MVILIYANPILLLFNFYACRANVGGGFQDGGFGVNGGFNTPLGGFNGDVGVRAPSFINNNLLTGLIVFLGVLSFINIIATVVTPWLNNIGGDDEEEKSIDTEKGRMYQRQINTMADYVLNGIESFAQKNQ